MNKNFLNWNIFILIAVSVTAFLLAQINNYSSDQMTEGILASVSIVKLSDSAPRFEDYPVAEIYTGDIAPVNLNSHPDAMTFKTRLREGVDYYGVNFAGHYTVIEIGCGTSCQAIWLIDAINGNVYRAPFISELGISIRKDSKLLTENPSESINSFLEGTGYTSVDWLKTRYYVWENNEFKFASRKPSDEFIGYPEWLNQ